MFQTIRVLVVDDHKLTCTAIHALLLDRVDIVIPSLTNFPKHCTQFQPDIVFLSYDLFREEQEAFVDVFACQLTTKIVLLLSNCNDICLNDFIDNDFYGCVLRDRIPDELLPVINSTIADIRCYSTPVVEQLKQLQNKSIFHTELNNNMTTREKEVLHLVTNGLSNKQIAVQLQISKSTVEFHMGNIFKKLNVNSRVEVVLQARKYHFF